MPDEMSKPALSRLRESDSVLQSIQDEPVWVVVHWIMCIRVLPGSSSAVSFLRTKAIPSKYCVNSPSLTELFSAMMGITRNCSFYDFRSKLMSFHFSNT